MAAGTKFEVDYNFYGMLPYYALPSDTTGVANPYDKTKMQTMLDYYAHNGTFGDDTYWGGKGLTQMALNMMFAREAGNKELFETCRDRLKSILEDWYTYTPGEKNHFFARYDRWGGLVGYATSYDSETFNDHHFHYGYFTLASALLALVDKDFRDNYGQMARLSGQGLCQLGSCGHGLSLLPHVRPVGRPFLCRRYGRRQRQRAGIEFRSHAGLGRNVSARRGFRRQGDARCRSVRLGE
jgi:hypothetical protein